MKMPFMGCHASRRRTLASATSMWTYGRTISPPVLHGDMAPEQGSDGLGNDTEAMRAYLRDQPLEFALLFGSQVTGTATEQSDVDLVVKFSDDLEPDERFRRRNRIAGELMARLGRDNVDVSDLDQLSTEIAHSALQEGVLLVGDEETLTEYRQQVATAYERTAVDRKRDRDALLRRLEQGTYGR